MKGAFGYIRTPCPCSFVEWTVQRELRQIWDIFNIINILLPLRETDDAIGV